MARFWTTGIEVIYYTYSIEIYPKLVRSVAFGLNLTFGNGCSITVLVIISIINSFLLMFLPETCGKALIETIPELED